ncbi:MAG: bifunctional 3-deoxy-7-phosphoheptulonate synthase/chorismate mutase type II [Paludibacteraceae bacterium]|nr:bifunctional 3-deoxy-7-phosphoheptulonate synthase/chorismate mutase type II [Paludibacteraceae bacterium]
MIKRPCYILGPCSAETREQTLLTVRRIKEACGDIPFIYRAGVWKPRTSPRSFRGAGEEALEWLQEVQQMGIHVATEVATPEHVVAALRAKIDYLWIGARTSANPIAVQALADTLSMQDFYPQGVFIKNPVHDDPQLWLGNIERLELVSVPVAAVHRGCNHRPCWAMAHEVRKARPDIPMLLDPSHLSGKAEMVEELMAKVPQLGLDGAMIEVHPNPSQALSDAAQQITPEELTTVLPLNDKMSRAKALNDVELNWLRAEIDELDDRLWQTLAERMDVSRRIGEWKKANHVPALQPMRYRQILAQRKQWAQKNGIDAAFIEQLFDLIHQESLKRQE